MVCGVVSYSQDGHEGPEGLPALSQDDGSLQKESESVSSFREDGGQVRINQWYLPQRTEGTGAEASRPFPHLVLPHTVTQELGCQTQDQCSMRQHPFHAHPSKKRSSKTCCASSIS